MYIFTTTSQQNGKKYKCTMIGESYRDGKNVRRRVIANISKCDQKSIDAIKIAFKHKDNIAALCDVQGDLIIKQGVSVGSVWLAHEIARRLGIVKALGTSKNAKLCLWQIIARLLGQGSRLSAVRYARTVGACSIIGLDGFNEDDLYASMDWLETKQDIIEDRLWKTKQNHKDTPRLFLYDVTSSYLEGEYNELGKYGYNRDKKKGKKQIVIGLLTDENGSPVSVEVFPGNTQDTETFGSQVKKVSDRFGVKEVVFVGDRGMIKTAQIETIQDIGKDFFHYITALTKPRINKLIRTGIIQLEFFDEDVYEIQDENDRYVLRRNPIRAEEIASNRQSKKKTIEQFVVKQNDYLSGHPRAQVRTAKRKVQDKVEKLKIDKWLKIKTEGRSLKISVNKEELEECSHLDGCYVLYTDIQPDKVSAETIHKRYKDLAQVEWAFRTMKTTLLEVRPIWVRKGKRTRAHVFIVMLAYMIARELRFLWSKIDCTVEEGLNELERLCSQHVKIKDMEWDKIPEPSLEQQELLSEAKVNIPSAIAHHPGNVVTRKKLQGER